MTAFSSAKLCTKAFSHLLQNHAILPQLLPINHPESSYHTLLVLRKPSSWNINITYYDVPNSNSLSSLDAEFQSSAQTKVLTVSLI